MSKHVPANEYFADDKDVWDLLKAKGSKVTVPVLLGFALERGVVLSPEDSKEDLINYISRLPMCWSQLSQFLTEMAPAQRVPRISSTRLSAVSSDALEQPLEAVRKMAVERGAECAVVRTTVGWSMNLTYQEMDPSKNRLTQRTERSFRLDIREAAGSSDLVISHPSQPRAHETVQDLLKVLRDQGEHPDAEDEPISLAGVPSASDRTRFFSLLARELEGFVLQEVKTVDAVPIKDLAKEVDASGDEELDEAELADKQDMLVSRIERVTLRGERLEATQRYRELEADRFFVAQMQWTAVEDKPDGALYELSAGFEDRDLCTQFYYSCDGMYPKFEEGFRKGKRRAELVEREDILRKLERSARAALAELVSEEPE